MECSLLDGDGTCRGDEERAIVGRARDALPWKEALPPLTNSSVAQSLNAFQDPTMGAILPPKIPLAIFKCPMVLNFDRAIKVQFDCTFFLSFFVCNKLSKLHFFICKKQLRYKLCKTI